MSATPGCKKKVALLGGSFNPVTRGHIQAADCVLRSGEANEVWLMPCYTHIYAKRLIPARHRLEMCALAAAGRAGIEVFDYEIRNQATSGTYALLSRLTRDPEYRSRFSFSMIIGQDNANTFHHWIKHVELSELVPFIVIPRRGVTPDQQVRWYKHPPHRYLEHDCRIMEVSSTRVRRLATRGEWDSLASLVPAGVADYIRSRGLYREDTPAPTKQGSAFHEK